MDAGAILNQEVRPIRAGEQVYNILREAILKGELKAGEQIDNSYLTKVLKTSRTPLREALNRLEADKWVIRQLNGRVVVAEISLKEVMDYYAIRSVLEGYAVREAIEYMDDKELEEINKQLSIFSKTADDYDLEKIVEAGKKLHSMIYRVAKNEICIRMLEDINDQLMRFRYHTANVPGRVEEALHEHLEIIGLLMEKRTDEAEIALKKHILRARDTLIAELNKNKTQQGGEKN